MNSRFRCPFQLQDRPLIAAFLLLFFAQFFTSVGGAVPAEGQKIMITGPSPDAIETGKTIARRGGSVADVAVAVAASLAVTHPYYAAFGGGGFVLMSIDGKISVLDCREVAPLKATEDLYLDKPANASADGGLAAAIPGLPAGLWELHKKHGKLPWKSLFANAIRLAEEGFEVSGEWAAHTAETRARFNPAGRAIFLKNDGTPLRPGDRLRQPKLARFLRAFSLQGPKAFYAGPVARDLVSAVNSSGGIWSLEDLTAYKVRWLEPMVTEFAGHKLYLMPPPSSGGVVITQALRLIEKLKLTEQLPLSTGELHGLAEVMKLTYRARSLLGDPVFVKNPTEQLLSEARLTELARQFSAKKTVPSETLKPETPPTSEREETTHFSVMDAKGNAIAFTLTLNGLYGSAVVSQAYGIALNNEMDDFTARPGVPNQFELIQGAANKVRPGARPLSSMSPTIIEKDGRSVMVLGAPGGPKIISSVLQVAYRSLTQTMNIDLAIQAPRVHHQFLPDVVTIDPWRFAPESLDLLRARGHKLSEGTTGKVYGIRRDDKGILAGAFDSRGEGAAGGF